MVSILQHGGSAAMENRLAHLLWKWYSWERGSVLPSEFSLILQSGALGVDKKTLHHGL